MMGAASGLKGLVDGDRERFDELSATWPELAERLDRICELVDWDNSRIRPCCSYEQPRVTPTCEVCEAEPAQFMVFHHDIGRIELVVCAQHAAETPVLLANIAILRAKASATADASTIVDDDL